MSRLRGLRPEELDEDAHHTWEHVTNGRRGSVGELTGADGGLIGPFNAMLYSPRIGGRVSELGEAIRFDASIDRRLVELAVVTVGAWWRSSFEFSAHAPLAAKEGVTADVIDALARGEEPQFDAADEQLVHRFTTRLLRDGRVDDETYRDTVALLGEQGVVELVVLCGYYTTVALLLNAFRVPVPAGEEPTWPI